MPKKVLIFVACVFGLVAGSWTDDVYQILPGPGKKFAITDEYEGIYAFNQKPQMGMIILRIEVYSKKGEKVTPFLIKGRWGMTSMPGAHDSGEVEFKQNRALNYLLPVNVVMPGDWEVRVTFFREGKPVFHGAIRFQV